MTEPIFHESYDFILPPWWKHPYAQAGFIVGAVVLVIFVIGGIWWLRRRAQEPKRSPLEWALLHLDRLSPASLKRPEEFREFYAQLTLLLKRYVQLSWNWPLIEKTDHEFMAWCTQHTNLSEEQRRILERILSGAVMIKFAAQDALPLQAREDWTGTRDLLAALAKPVLEPQA